MFSRLLICLAVVAMVFIVAVPSDAGQTVGQKSVYSKTTVTGPFFQLQRQRQRGNCGPNGCGPNQGNQGMNLESESTDVPADLGSVAVTDTDVSPAVPSWVVIVGCVAATVAGAVACVVGFVVAAKQTERARRPSL